MAIFKTVVQNTASQLVGKAVTLALSLLITALLTRLLGVEGYGAYTFVTAFVLLFGTISDWGTTLIAVREASKKKEEQAKIFGTALSFRFLLTGLSVFVLNIVIRMNPAWHGFIFPTGIASLALLGLSLKTSLGVIFQTLLRYERAAVVEIFSSLVFLGGVLFFLFRGGGLEEILLSWVFSTLVAATLGYFLAKSIADIEFGIEKTIVKKIFWEAAPTGALLLTFSVYNRVDTIILEHFHGEAAVGIYGLSYKVHDNLVLGAAFLMNSMFPFLSKKFAQKKKTATLRQYYQKTFDLLFGGAVLVAGAALIFSPLIIQVLAGQAFTPSIGVLRILAFATFIAYFNHLTGYSLIAFGRQRTSLAIAVVALVFNIVANLIFVPKFSYTASALITVATEGLVLLLSSLVVFQTIRAFPSLLLFPKTWVSLIKKRGEVF